MGDVRPLWGRRCPFLGLINIQEARRWPLWASYKLPHMPQGPNTLPHPPGNVQSTLVASCPSSHHTTCRGWSPIGQSLPKRPDEGVLLLLHARARHNSVLPLPSQQPSDGLFSPMEVRANHLPMCTDPLVPVRRAWSCTSKTTPSMGSSVLDIIAM